MITTIKEAKELARQYNAIKTDLERLAFLKEYRWAMTVVLDNDMTMVEFREVGDEDLNDVIEDIELNEFDNYHGWTDGVVELFRFAGITCETC